MQYEVYNKHPSYKLIRIELRSYCKFLFKTNVLFISHSMCCHVTNKTMRKLVKFIMSSVRPVHIMNILLCICTILVYDLCCIFFKINFL